ncbi:MAG TPA: outer membrane beta-barrel protein [Candidatus Saccharimonadia bacterium]|nr:outer membrane beta-barrel protein [Candidatus Saccharimonadia bacterium]
MGGLMIWWCGRRRVPGQQRRQEGHSYVAGIWWLQGIIVVLLALVATAAYGQESSQRLTLTPSLSLGERYDDNIFETRTNKQHDFITVLSPGIRAQYLTTAPAIGTQFDFDYRANFEFFADNTNQTNVGHRLSLTLASPLAPSLEVRLRDLFLITENPLARDERLSSPTGLRPVSQQQRDRTIHNEAEGRADIRLGGRMSLGVLFGSLVDDVSVPQELDEFRYTVGTELGYALNVARDSRVFVAYQVTFESFRDNGIVPSGNSDAAFQVHAIGTGVRHELTPTLAVDAGLGYSFTTSDAPQKDGHKGVIGNVKLTKTFNNGQASLGYARRFSAGGSTGDVVTDDTVSAIASINLTGKLTAKLNSNVTWSNFQSVTTSTSTSDNSDQRFLSIRPSLTYQILRPWVVSVAYTYEYTSYTDSTTANFSDHRLVLSTQYALREWLGLGLSYRYGTRRVHGGNVAVGGVEEFTGNQVMLTVTASPSLRF